MYRIIFILCLIFCTATTYANEAEFDRLYSEYHANLVDDGDFDLTMQLAIKLHKMAPLVHGKNSAVTADVTYNLARLLDDAAGAEFNAGELIATKLYQDYFAILDELDTPKDKQYLDRYVQFLRAETNSMFLFVDDRNLKRAVRMLRRIDLAENEKGDFEFSFAGIYASRAEPKKAREYYNKSIKSYKKEFGDNHSTIAASLIELLKLDMREINQSFVAAQNDLMYGRRNAEKRTIRKARKIHANAEKKAIQIASLLNNEDINAPRLSDSYNEIKDNYDLFKARFSSFAYSDDAFKIAKKVKTSSDDETSSIKVTPIERKNPFYPGRASQTRLEGWVMFQFDVNIEGKVENIRLIEASHDVFVRPALFAASKYIYEPPTLDGRPSAAKGRRVRIDFRLSDNNETDQRDAI